MGKTAHAIEVAQHLNTVILSADSRQCYKELNIGVARPTANQLKQAPHYFIASHSVREQLNAAWYEAYTLNLLNHLFKSYNNVVVTGGTGLYIKALTQGLDAIPEVPESIRQNIIQQYTTHGKDWLQQQLLTHDPLYAAQGEMQNPQRMMRALEVFLETGQSIISFRQKEKKTRPFNIVQLGIELPRHQLHARINTRVDMMMEAGLESEARTVLPFRQLNALQTVGYSELFNYFDGNIPLPQAIELIKQNTRRYAKRQMTWFKKQEGIHWVDAQNCPSLIPLIDKLLLPK